MKKLGQNLPLLTIVLFAVLKVKVNPLSEETCNVKPKVPFDIRSTAPILVLL